MAAVAAHRGAETRIADEQVQTLHELIAVRVEESRVAPEAVFDEHFASRVDQHRRSDGERLEREQRQALER